MGIRFACHQCGRRLNIKNDLAGKRGVCPGCEGRFRIPLRDADFSLGIDDEDSAPKPAVGRLTGGHVGVGVPVTGANGHGRNETSAPQAAATSVRAAPSTYPLLTDDPEAAWYVRPSSGGQYGPAGGDKLAQWIEEGRVATSSLVWRDGWPQWRSAAEAFPDLATKMPQASRAETVARVVATASRAVPRTGIPTSPTGEAIELTGDPTIGAARGKRSRRRGISIGMLVGVCLALLGVLIYIVSR